MSDIPQASLRERIRTCGIVPVITISTAEVAVPLVEALAGGGLGCAEITLRTEAGLAAIRRVHEALPNLLVGAGTVLTADQARRAIVAGAQFVVTPGFMPRVAEVCLAENVPIFPGVMTPTEIADAWMRRSEPWPDPFRWSASSRPAASALGIWLSTFTSPRFWLLAAAGWSGPK